MLGLGPLGPLGPQPGLQWSWCSDLYSDVIHFKLKLGTSFLCVLHSLGGMKVLLHATNMYNFVHIKIYKTLKPWNVRLPLKDPEGPSQSPLHYKAKMLCNQNIAQRLLVSTKPGSMFHTTAKQDFHWGMDWGHEVSGSYHNHQKSSPENTFTNDLVILILLSVTTLNVFDKQKHAAKCWCKHGELHFAATALALGSCSWCMWKAWQWMLKNEALQFQFQPKKVEESELRKTCTSSYIYN